MARILNKEVRKKLEEMAINPAAVSGEEQGGNLLLYLSGNTLVIGENPGSKDISDRCLASGASLGHSLFGASTLIRITSCILKS